MNPIQLKIEKLNLFPIHSYSVSTKECRICMHDNLICVECLNSCTNIVHNRCPFSRGKCGHGFHKHCINKWLDDGGQVCPICKVMWIYDKEDMDGDPNAYKKNFHTRNSKKRITVSKVTPPKTKPVSSI